METKKISHKMYEKVRMDQVTSSKLRGYADMKNLWKWEVTSIPKDMVPENSVENKPFRGNDGAYGPEKSIWRDKLKLMEKLEQKRMRTMLKDEFPYMYGPGHALPLG